MRSSKTDRTHVAPPPPDVSSRAKPSATRRFIPREELARSPPGTPDARRRCAAAASARDVAAPPEPEPPPPERASWPRPARQARHAGYQDGYRDGLVALEGFKQSFAPQIDRADRHAGRSRSTAQLDALQQQMARALAVTATAAGAPDRAQRARAPARAWSPRWRRGARDAAAERAPHHRARAPRRPALVVEGAADVLSARGARAGRRRRRRARRLPRRVRHRRHRRQHRDALARVPPPRSAATSRWEAAPRQPHRRRPEPRMTTTPPRADADATADTWQRYLADMQSFAAEPVPLETQGLLVRVAGLVLEAAGIRVPVGSVCECACPARPPVLAEVVGFSGDRAFLMPTGDIAWPGKRRPRGAARRRPSCRCSSARRATLAPQRRPHAAPAGRRRPARPRRRLARPADRPPGPAAARAQRAADPPPDQRDGPRPGAPARSTPACARSTRCSPSAAASASACSPAPASASRCCSG